MIQIVMKPDKAPVVNREGLYVVLFNGRDVGLRVRALRASHAEAKLMETLEESVRGKKDPVDGKFTIDFDLERWLEGKDKENVGDQENGAAPEGGA
jgi:hypothetical protein